MYATLIYWCLKWPCRYIRFFILSIKWLICCRTVDKWLWNPPIFDMGSIIQGVKRHLVGSTAHDDLISLAWRPIGNISSAADDHRGQSAPIEWLVCSFASYFTEKAHLRRNDNNKWIKIKWDILSLLLTSQFSKQKIVVEAHDLYDRFLFLNANKTQHSN